MANPTIVWSLDPTDPFTQKGRVNGVVWYSLREQPIDFEPSVWFLSSSLPFSGDAWAVGVERDQTLIKAKAVEELVKFVKMVRNAMGVLGLIGGLL